VNSDEIRTEYLKYFEDKGHKIIPSSSLIPHGDPTLLLTSAGMVQIKPYFTGKEIPPSPRLVSCQKCFRTTDIEEVGDATHLTFFEMLGNFSVGDYFKQEAIDWAWEFVTKNLPLSPDKLWVSIFLDDDEAYEIWRKIGIPEDRIVRLGEEDNFWGPVGNSGPCGPCSEIYYDFGKESGCGKPSCAPGCDCARFAEIWNLVFTQFNQDEDGKRTLLPNPNIDTGMGLERTLTAISGSSSIYETDLFRPYIEKIEEISGKRHGSNSTVSNAMRVVVEHGRGITFLIADGVMPGNEGRGYVLRRLIRRAALFGRSLGIEKSFLTDIAGIAIKKMSHIYPEIKQKSESIFKVIKVEEARFSETLSMGLELIEGLIENLNASGSKEISGVETFKLYDTYGFPVELTKEIAESRGLSVDLSGFENEMEKQRERAKEAHKFETASSAGIEKKLRGKKTTFTGYDNLKQTSTIIGLFTDSESLDVIQEGQEATVILSTTPFYGEMGGQAGDTGRIQSSTGLFKVDNTIHINPDVIAHTGHVESGSLMVKDGAEAEVDRERRLDVARNHTATHLLQFALRKVLGDMVEQRGSLVSPERLRFDFSYLEGMLPEEIQQVQQTVNEMIREDLEVYPEEMSYDSAMREGAIALFNEKYGDVVRVLRIGKPAASTELCGGTHITATGQIGYFHILSEGSIGSGLRRIEAVTGRGAEHYIDSRLSDLAQISKTVGGTMETALEKVDGLISELDEEKKQTLILEREYSRQIAEKLVGQVEEVKGIMVLVTRVYPFPQQILREMSDFIRERLESVIVVLGTVHDDRPAFLAAVTPDLVKKGYNAGSIVKQVAQVTGGGGGGKATLAQAGGRNKDKLDEALRLVKDLI